MAKRAGEALLLSFRNLGDTGMVATLFSAEFGLLRGLMRKTEGRMPGDTVRFTHSRRLNNQLGSLACEVAVSRAGLMLSDTSAALLAGYLAELAHHVLPEDHPYPDLYQTLQNVWHQPQPWWQRLAELERMLLATVGYGLSLSDDAVPCAGSGRLMYVSPNSGRAVSEQVGAPYAARLLPLPALWGGPAVDEATDRRHALHLTGFFIERALHGKGLTSRARLVEHLCMKERDRHEMVENLDAGSGAAERRRYG